MPPFQHQVSTRTMSKLILTFLLIISAMALFAQNNPKQLTAVRTKSKIVIDGDISDAAWSSAANASGLVEWRPTFGKQEDKETRTEVYLLYDDNAFYIAGFCHERTTDSISKELVGRDVLA